MNETKQNDRFAKFHHLKTWPRFFQPMWNGEKPFEIRKNDRDFRVGDILILDEWDPDSEKEISERYTGRAMKKRVKFIMPLHEGLREGYVAMAVEDMPQETASGHDDILQVIGRGNHISGSLILKKEFWDRLFVGRDSFGYKFKISPGWNIGDVVEMRCCVSQQVIPYRVYHVQAYENGVAVEFMPISFSLNPK